MVMAGRGELKKVTTVYGKKAHTSGYSTSLADIAASPCQLFVLHSSTFSYREHHYEISQHANTMVSQWLSSMWRFIRER